LLLQAVAQVGHTVAAVVLADFAQQRLRLHLAARTRSRSARAVAVARVAIKAQKEMTAFLQRLQAQAAGRVVRLIATETMVGRAVAAG
jgi:hypothetical protein